MATNITVVVLAAGQGKRMRSDLPKVLHPLAGRPLLAHVLGSARALRARELRVVHGHGGEHQAEGNTLDRAHGNSSLMKREVYSSK